VCDVDYRRKVSIQIVEIERLRSALQGLHDWCVDYVRTNNSPATFNELLEARRVLEAIE
jgi:hypothetical protein